MEFSYKKLCIYFYMFKLQSPSKYSPFVAVHQWGLSFHFSEQFLNSSLLLPFSASAVFLFYFFRIHRMFPFEYTKSLEAGSDEQGEWGLEVIAVFGKKLLNTECGVGRRDHKSPIMKWTDMWKASSLPFFLPLPSPPHPTRPGQIYS